MNSLKKLAVRVRNAAQSPWRRRWLKVARAAFTVGVVAWLVYQLSGIGWADVWASRPRTPWFYVAWLGLYLQLPLIEAFIYRGIWKLSVPELLPPILRKRVLNQDVVSYSGEAYFFVWARRRLHLSDRHVAGTLKDNAIASSLASWAAAVLLISVFLFTGQIVLTDLIEARNQLYVATGIGLTVALVAVGVRFRRTIFTLPPRTVLRLFGAHFGRFMLLVYVLQILQWWVVLPEAPMSVWATMLAVMTLINRIPLIPATDLVAIGAVLGMSDLLAASAATIAAMLVTRSVLDKSLNLLLFAVISVVDRRKARAAATMSDGHSEDEVPPVAEIAMSSPAEAQP